ncbi:MAG: hypothetical protein VX768_18125 [Planctomycetota bacterium]|nr:hypothetical protein [Planctomycetota bacterium]
MTLPISNRTVVSHQVNLDQELEKAGIDYLYVVSRPETTVAAGKQFRYQLETRSKNGGVR